MDRPASKQLEVIHVLIQTSIDTHTGTLLLLLILILFYHDLQKATKKIYSHHIAISQVIASAEDSLKDFEQRITELKTRGAVLQVDQISTNKLLKLQVLNKTDSSQ